MRRAACLALVALFAPARALANGAALPDTVQFESQAPAANDWAMNTTFGFLFSDDAGASWKWTCHEAIVGTVSITPKSWRSPNGDVFVGAPLGLGVDPGIPVYRTADHGCHWMPVASLASDGVLALAFSADGSIAVAAGTSNSADEARAWISSDGGATFGVPAVTHGGASSRFFTSALVAPSDPQRIYLTYLVDSPAYAAVLRSDDGGRNWNEYPFAFAEQPTTRLLGVSATNADVVWLREDAADDRVLVSTDGGISFAPRLLASGRDVVGFAQTADGRAWIATRTTGGIFEASGTGGFSPVATHLFPRCLDASGNALFVCANPYVDPFAAGETLDAGAAFSTAMSFARIDAPVDCPNDAGSSAAICDAIWPNVEAKIHGTASPTPSVTPTPGNPGDGGGRGCGCDLADPVGASGLVVPGAIAALVLARTRKKGRSGPRKAP